MQLCISSSISCPPHSSTSTRQITKETNRLTQISFVQVFFLDRALPSNCESSGWSPPCNSVVILVKRSITYQQYWCMQISARVSAARALFLLCSILRNTHLNSVLVRLKYWIFDGRRQWKLTFSVFLLALRTSVTACNGHCELCPHFPLRSRDPFWPYSEKEQNYRMQHVFGCKSSCWRLEVFGRPGVDPLFSFSQATLSCCRRLEDFGGQWHRPILSFHAIVRFVGIAAWFADTYSHTIILSFESWSCCDGHLEIPSKRFSYDSG